MVFCVKKGKKTQSNGKNGSRGGKYSRGGKWPEKKGGKSFETNGSLSTGRGKVKWVNGGREREAKSGSQKKVAATKKGEKKRRGANSLKHQTWKKKEEPTLRTQVAKNNGSAEKVGSNPLARRRELRVAAKNWPGVCATVWLFPGATAGHHKEGHN